MKYSEEAASICLLMARNIELAGGDRKEDGVTLASSYQWHSAFYP
jgi:hypothetical protein